MRNCFKDKKAGKSVCVCVEGRGGGGVLLPFVSNHYEMLTSSGAPVCAHVWLLRSAPASQIVCFKTVIFSHFLVSTSVCAQRRVCVLCSEVKVGP